MRRVQSFNAAATLLDGAARSRSPMRSPPFDSTADAGADQPLTPSPRRRLSSARLLRGKVLLNTHDTQTLCGATFLTAFVVVTERAPLPHASAAMRALMLVTLGSRYLTRTHANSSASLRVRRRVPTSHGLYGKPTRTPRA